jgi:hypothetical protein
MYISTIYVCSDGLRKLIFLIVDDKTKHDSQKALFLAPILSFFTTQTISRFFMDDVHVNFLFGNFKL